VIQVSSINKTVKFKKAKVDNILKGKVLFDSTKTNEYKGAHSIGCKN
jgi:hypothetical protein